MSQEEIWRKKTKMKVSVHGGARREGRCPISPVFSAYVLVRAPHVHEYAAGSNSGRARKYMETRTTRSGGRERIQMKLFVGGLSWDTDDNGLRKAFEHFGDIEEAGIVKEKYMDRSRGSGFVTFRASDAAAEAIEKLDGSELDGRSITVNEAQERISLGSGSRDGRDGDGRSWRGGGSRRGRRNW